MKLRNNRVFQPFGVLITAGVVLIGYVIITGQEPAEYTGWIKGKTCWVVRTPSKDAKIIGIILYKAAVSVKDAKEEGWLQIFGAPVRDPVTMKWLDWKETNGCYIQKHNFTTMLPGRWPKHW